MNQDDTAVPVGTVDAGPDPPAAHFGSSDPTVLVCVICGMGESVKSLFWSMLNVVNDTFVPNFQKRRRNQRNKEVKTTTRTMNDTFLSEGDEDDCGDDENDDEEDEEDEDFVCC